MECIGMSADDIEAFVRARLEEADIASDLYEQFSALETKRSIQ